MSHPIVRFAAETLGFPLHPRQAEILEEIYTDGIRTAVLRLGRRSGKGSPGRRRGDVRGDRERRRAPRGAAAG